MQLKKYIDKYIKNVISLHILKIIVTIFMKQITFFDALRTVFQKKVTILLKILTSQIINLKKYI